MTVTEHLMRPGTWSLKMIDDVPDEITNRIYKAMELAGGSGAHIVITPTRLDVDVLPVTAVLDVASFTGRMTRRPTRTSIEGVGILSWLNTSPKTPIERNVGTPNQWIGDLAVNGLTGGTVTNTGATSVTRAFPAYMATHRELLDAVAAAGGWEYRVRPNFTIDAAISATLFDSHASPDLVVTRKRYGPDGELRGVEGGIVDQELDDSDLAGEVAVIAEGNGAAVAVGSATQALSLLTWNGSTPELVSVVSSPGTPGDDADTVAAATLALRAGRRKVRVSSRTFALHRFARPGDYVWLYDPQTGLVDPTNTVQFNGATITPAKVRLLSWTWPIEDGLGVYLLENGATPTLTDLTGWIVAETGDTVWTVGDWNPPGFGPVNRAAPDVEERLASPPTSATIVTGAAQSIPNAANTTLTYDTAVFNPHGWWDGTGVVTQVTVPRDGLYRVSLHVEHSGTNLAAGTRLILIVTVNGTNTYVREEGDAGGVSPDRSVSGLLKLDAGDNVAALMFQNDGAARTFAPTLAVEYVGAV